MGKRRVKLSTRKVGTTVHTNTSVIDKVKIRHHVLEKLGVDNPRILDAFCAKGEMWRDAYGETDNYVGLDLEKFIDKRNTVICDNVRYLRQADLDQFDIFDLDAFGSPFECLAVIAHRIKWSRTKRVGIVLTDGTGVNSKFNAMNREFLGWIGASPHVKARVQMNDRENFIVGGMLKAAKMCDAFIEDVLVAFKNKGGAEMRYIGYIMRHAEEGTKPEGEAPEAVPSGDRLAEALLGL